MAIILIIIILKTSLQVIRGASSRREPLKSISEAYCLQWKIKPAQDCCADALSRTCVMWNCLEAKYDGSLRFPTKERAGTGALMDQSCTCVCLLLSISVSSGELAQQQNYRQNKINVHENLNFSFSFAQLSGWISHWTPCVCITDTYTS